MKRIAWLLFPAALGCSCPTQNTPQPDPRPATDPPPRSWVALDPAGENPYWEVRLEQGSWSLEMRELGRWTLQRLPDGEIRVQGAGHLLVVQADGDHAWLRWDGTTTACDGPRDLECLHEAWSALPQDYRDALMRVGFQDYGPAGEAGLDEIVSVLARVFFWEGPYPPPPARTWRETSGGV